MNHNELIVIFMGCVKVGPFHYEKTDGFELWHRDELLFHKSWDWIMPVIEKLRNTDPTRTTQGSMLWQNIIAALTTTRIEQVHKAVVEFIKWYNTPGTNPRGI